MGLFSNKKEGGLMDVIRCDEQEYLVWKWRPSGEANSTHKENAIRYGLEENTEGCLISISAEPCPEKDQLIIYVKNDGSAFEDDLLSKLENRQIEPHGFGIGLLNIQKRMQLTYGEAYGLTLYNEEELAVAKLVYPLKPVILSPDAEASLTV